MTEEIDETLKKLVADEAPSIEIQKVDKTDEKFTVEHKLRQAVMVENLEALKEIVDENDVDINCQHPQTMQTPLHIACSKSNFDIVKYLLGIDGIDTAAKDHFKNAPIDLLPRTPEGQKIKSHILGSKVSSDVKLEDIVSIDSLKGDFHFHLYICHAYKDHAAAKKLKEKLEGYGVKVAMNESMIGDRRKIEADIKHSKLIIIFASRSFFDKLKDPETYKRSACVIEMGVFTGERDVSKIVIVARDQTGNSIKSWQEVPEYEIVAEEELVFDLSNSKVFEENFPLVYKEIKMRITI